jgi:hypothetical protein
VGILKYDGMSVDFDDRLLAHVQTVVVQKVRRQEPFLLTWQDSDDLGGGRTSIWIHQFAHMTFHFASNSDPKIDRAWLEKLMGSANSPRGMFVSDEDGKPEHPSDMDLGR